MSEVKNLETEEKIVEKPSIFGMIWSPIEQFERIRERPRILGPMAIIIGLFIVGMLITMFSVDTGLEGLSNGEMAGFAVFLAVTSGILGVIAPIIGTLISSFIYWIIAKLARSEVYFKQLFSMCTYIMIISVLGSIINGVGIAILGGDGETMFTSLGSFIPVEGAIGGLLNSIELFGIWGVILAALGLNRVANFSKGLAWTVSIAFFVIGVVFAMIGAAFSGMVGV
ncbi:Yip1 family protein [Oceanobacillus caeni]|uniref:Yip1 family protein n=1 Tax=Oceanobacillus caeni TaxID=405946 RepID=UPI00362B6C4D